MSLTSLRMIVRFPVAAITAVPAGAPGHFFIVAVETYPEVGGDPE